MESFMPKCIAPEDLDLDKVCVYEDKNGYFDKKPSLVRFGYKFDIGDGDGDEKDEVPSFTAPLGFAFKYPKLTGTIVHPILTGMVHHDNYPLYAGAKMVCPEMQQSLEGAVYRLAEKCNVEVDNVYIESHDTPVYSVQLNDFLPKVGYLLDALLYMCLNGFVVCPRFVYCKQSGKFDCHCRIVIACTK
jgi:hypothetical protein